MSREIKQYVLGPVNVNCYVVINKDTKECFVVDPGDSPDVFVKSFEVEGLIIAGIILTHGHFDHISGIKALVEKYDAKVYALEQERELLATADLNLSSRIGRTVVEVKDVIGVEDGQNLEIAGFNIKAIATPGHTSGGVCYFIESEGIMFTGDTLFAGCIGRTDLPTGNTKTLVKSIRERLFTLPEDTIVYPGHSNATTIEHEKQHNPMV